MARKRSDRRKVQELQMDVDLTPMMNLISILIPVLLVSAVFVEMSVLNVSAPAIGSAADASNADKKDDKPPLNLTVTITDQGYTLAASGGVLGNEQAAAGTDGKGPTIPVIQAKVKCGRYAATWPPPRSKNRSQPPCQGDVEQTFWVYDHATLTKKLAEIKDAFPDERRIIIAAEPEIDYETITDTMDASREMKDAAGEHRTLFDEVVLSPGLS